MRLVLTDIFFLVERAWISLLSLDFGQINYSQIDLARWIGLALLAILLVKVIFGRNVFSHKYSGHFISDKDQQSIKSKTLHMSPKLLLASGLIAILIALA